MMPSATTSSPITLHDLGNALDGRLVLPSNARYASTRLVYDLRYETERPLAIAYCASPLDVARFLWLEIRHAARELLSDIHVLASHYGWAERDIASMSPLRRAAYLQMWSA